MNSRSPRCADSRDRRGGRRVARASASRKCRSGCAARPAWPGRRPAPWPGRRARRSSSSASACRRPLVVVAPAPDRRAPARPGCAARAAHLAARRGSAPGWPTTSESCAPSQPNQRWRGDVEQARACCDVPAAAAHGGGAAVLEGASPGRGSWRRRSGHRPTGADQEEQRWPKSPRLGPLVHAVAGVACRRPAARGRGAAICARSWR